MREEGQGTPAPEPAAEVAPEPAPTGKVSWKDKLKSAATQAATQGKQLAEQAKEKVAEQQSKRIEQWENDPDTLWFGASKNAATGATGIAKAYYRLTKDRIWIETGVLGTRSEYVPLWAIKDIDVRQNVLQRGKDEGDVALHLDDPSLGVDQSGAFGLSGDQLKKLAELRDQGILTDDEFAAQKAKLLG